MVKILGIADLLAASLLLATALKFDIPIGMLIFISLVLFSKSLICLYDMGSIIDISVVVLLILSIFINIPYIILYIAAGLIGVKGIMSLAA